MSDIVGILGKMLSDSIPAGCKQLLKALDDPVLSQQLIGSKRLKLLGADDLEEMVLAVGMHN